MGGNIGGAVAEGMGQDGAGGRQVAECGRQEVGGAGGVPNASARIQQLLRNVVRGAAGGAGGGGGGEGVAGGCGISGAPSCSCR